MDESRFKDGLYKKLTKAPFLNWFRGINFFTFPQGNSWRTLYQKH